MNSSASIGPEVWVAIILAISTITSTIATIIGNAVIKYLDKEAQEPHRQAQSHLDETSAAQKISNSAIELMNERQEDHERLLELYNELNCKLDEAITRNDELEKQLKKLQQQLNQEREKLAEANRQWKATEQRYRTTKRKLTKAETRINDVTDWVERYTDSLRAIGIEPPKLNGIDIETPKGDNNAT